MDRPARLSLFGVIHMDAVEKVTEELDAFVGDAEALFIEYPAEPAGLRTWLQVLLRTPAFFVGVLVAQLFLQGPLTVLLVKDLLPAEFVATNRLAEADDLPVHRVDEHPVQRAAAAGPKWILPNWLGVATVAALEPLAVAVTVGAMSLAALVPVWLRRLDYRRLGPALFVAGLLGVLALAVRGPFSVLAVLVGYLAYMLTINLGIGHRNDVMLDRVERVAADEGYDDVVLVTGKGHLAGLARDAAQRGISVPRIHVSFWRDVGETHFAFDPSDLPEIGVERGGFRENLRESLAELPRHLRRVGAAVVDVVGVGVVWFVAVFVVLFSFELVTGIPFQRVGDAVMLGGAYVAVVGYHAALEATWGRTVGKRLAGLVVRSSDGGPLSAREALVRNVLRPFDMALLYVLSGVALTSTSRHQSLADLVGATVVGRPDAEHMTRDGRPPSAAGAAGRSRGVPLTEHEPPSRSGTDPTVPRVGGDGPTPDRAGGPETDRERGGSTSADDQEVETTVDWEF